MAGNTVDDLEKITQIKANISSLTTPQVDAVKKVGCSSTIGQTLNPKKKETQLEPSIFGDSLDEEDVGRAAAHKCPFLK